MQSPAVPCYFVTLRPKCLPQYRIIKLPQPTFLPQYGWPRFTPILSNSQNYRSVYCNIYIFGNPTGRQNILDKMVGGIPRVKSALNFSLNTSFIVTVAPNMWIFDTRSKDISHRVKKNQLDAQLIRSIFCQPLHVSGVSRPIIRRYNRMYTTIGTYFFRWLSVVLVGLHIFITWVRSAFCARDRSNRRNI